MKEDNIAKPTLLRWAGSKRKLIPQLSRYWNDSGANRYIEPFAGSACLFFSIDAKDGVIGDLNKDLISTYRAVRDSWRKVQKELKKLPVSSDAYYNLRGMNIEGTDAAFRAARFIYLNRNCFNGLYRTNKNGEFNVPFGGAGVLPDAMVFREVSRRLKRVKLIYGDFEKTISQAQPGDFVYMDPPYSVENKRVFIDYDPAKFSLDDIHRLRKCMEVLDKKGIKFLVSYLDSPEANFLKKGFTSKKIEVRRSIAGFATSRKKASEIMITNIK